MKLIALTLFLFSSLAKTYQVPMQEKDWKVLEYKKFTPNKVIFDKDSIKIRVNSSAGSIFHGLKKPIKLDSFAMKVTQRGKLNLKGRQGNGGVDDFTLRIGFVVEGDKSLGFFARKLAPDWLLTVFDSAPKGSKASYVQFYNIVENQKQLGQKREHPANDLLLENFTYKVPESGTLNISTRTKLKDKVIGIWICSDGDETKSSFDVQFSNFKLNIEE